MKINVELDLDFVDENCNLNDLFKQELKHAFHQEAAKIIAKQDFAQFNRDAEILELKKAYEAELSELRKTESIKRQEVNDKIDSVFQNILDDIAVVTTEWGKEISRTTVKEFLQDKITKELGDLQKVLTKKVAEEVKRQVQLSEYDVKRLVETEAKQIQNENAKKVAEFIIKGVA